MIVAAAAFASLLTGGASAAPFSRVGVPSMRDHALRTVQFDDDPDEGSALPGQAPPGYGGEPLGRPMTVYGARPGGGYAPDYYVPPGPYSRQAPWVAPPGYYGGSIGAYRRDLQFCNNQPSRCY